MNKSPKQNRTPVSFLNSIIMSGKDKSRVWVNKDYG